MSLVESAAVQPNKLIVTFHGIGTPPPATPEAERHYWAAKSRFVALVPEVIQAAVARRLQPIFTFDDGNLSDLVFAAPVLAAAGAQAIFFPCTDRIGHDGYLSGHDIRALQKQGFEIGSHGMAHLPWARLGAAVLEAEVCQSKRVLEALTGVPLRAAALPFGSYGRATLVALRRAGYGAVYSSDPGLCRPGQWLCPRFSYRADLPFDPADLADRAARLRYRVLREVKGLIKSLR